MHVGLYFGSFNPIHNGHIGIAQQLLAKVGFDEVWLVVSPQNPLKADAELAPERDRLAMASLAVQELGLPIRVSDIELGLPRPSYTVSTLAVLGERYPAIRFSLIMGSDNVAVIERWKDYQAILRGHSVYFFPRLGDDSDALAQRYGVTKVAGDYLDISSTEIRQRIASGLPIGELVPSAVAKYIADNHLYIP